MLRTTSVENAISTSIQARWFLNWSSFWNVKCRIRLCVWMKRCYQVYKREKTIQQYKFKRYANKDSWDNCIYVSIPFCRFEGLCFCLNDQQNPKEHKIRSFCKLNAHKIKWVMFKQHLSCFPLENCSKHSSKKTEPFTKNDVRTTNWLIRMCGKRAKTPKKSTRIRLPMTWIHFS